MRTVNIKAKTVGETIDQLAEAFSGEGDTLGLFILEQAYDKARELRSAEQRNRESAEIFARVKASRDIAK